MRRPDSKFTLTRRRFALASVLGSAAAIIGCRSAARGDWDFLTRDQHAEGQAGGHVCKDLVTESQFERILGWVGRRAI
jgi:hypothetical protein